MKPITKTIHINQTTTPDDYADLIAASDSLGILDTAGGIGDERWIVLQFEDAEYIEFLGWCS